MQKKGRIKITLRKNDGMKNAIEMKANRNKKEYDLRTKIEDKSILTKER